jgi:hypothetical protein
MFEFKNVDEGMEVFALGNQGLKIPRREEMSGKIREQKKRSVRNNGSFPDQLLSCWRSLFLYIK